MCFEKQPRIVEVPMDLTSEAPPSGGPSLALHKMSSGHPVDTKGSGNTEGPSAQGGVRSWCGADAATGSLPEGSHLV